MKDLYLMNECKSVRTIHINMENERFICLTKSFGNNLKSLLANQEYKADLKKNQKILN